MHEKIEQAFGDTTYTLFPVHARNDHNNKKINLWINIVCAFSEAAFGEIQYDAPKPLQFAINFYRI